MGFFTKERVFFLLLAFFMVFTGSVNTITTKIADLQNSKGIDGKVRPFEHPFFQAVGMFLGEFLCMLAFRAAWLYKKCRNIEQEQTKFNPLIFVVPALCDMTATSLMYLGLTWTYASVFQMLRGSVIIFTGILSVIFLKRKLYVIHWLGMILILGGLAAVGASSILFDNGGGGQNAPHPLWGDILVVCAQIIVAVQMVVEEKFISKYNVPALLVVGWEGLWGFCVLSCVLVGMYFIPGSSAGNHFENSLDAFVQMGNNPILVVALMGNVLSIAFFNFFGISITKYMSATTRMVLDSVRTLVIWLFSLIVHWQTFNWLQLVGFALLILGMVLYNRILPFRFPYPCEPRPEDEEKEKAGEEGKKLINETPEPN